MKSIATYQLLKLIASAAMLMVLGACTGGISSSSDMTDYAHVAQTVSFQADELGIDAF